MNILMPLTLLISGALMGCLIAPLIRGGNHGNLSNIAIGGIGGLFFYQYLQALSSANLFFIVGPVVEGMIFLALFVAEARDS